MCKVDLNLLYHATLLIGAYQYTKFERDWSNSSRSRDMEHRFLARAHVQSHPNCDTHRYTYCRVVVYMHAKFQRNRPSSYQDISIVT